MLDLTEAEIDALLATMPDLGDELADPLAELATLAEDIGSGPDADARSAMVGELRAALVGGWW